MRLAGYMRVSRVAGREHLISPELQEKRIRGFAEIRGWSVEVFPPELDVSGGRVRRPILEEIIERIERGEFDGVIVSQMDRLSRMEMTTALTVIERIEEAGGQIVAVAENVDPTTPEGRMARNVFLSLAAMERERHAAQLAESKERAVRLGIWPVSKVPLGYTKGADRKLKPNRDAERVRRAFETRAAGGSWREVAAVLEVGESRAWKTLRNRVYLGEINVGEWSNPTAHPAIIDRGLWESVQGRNQPPNGHRGEGTWLLKGLVRCGGCQRTMSANERAYRCLARVPCDLRARIPFDVIDPIAERLVLEIAGKVGQEAREVDEEPLAELEAAEAELRAFQRASKAAGDEDLFAEGLRERADAVREARTRVSSVRVDLPRVVVGEEWPNLTVDEKRHVLRGLFGVVWIWSRDRFRFVARGFEPHDLSRPGIIGPEPAPLEDSPLPGEIGMPPADDVQ